MAKISEIIAKFEEFAPLSLAEDWDNSGLLVGDPSAETQRVLVTLDVDGKVAREAALKRAGLIMCHHPVMFKPLKRFAPGNPDADTVAELIRSNIALYAAHTNLDAAKGGINDYLCGLLGIEGAKPLEPACAEALYKLCVFVPSDYVDRVREAMSGAGAGHIGNYSHCTFMSKGTGTFLPLDGAAPFLGRVGELEYADETKVETIVPQNRLGAVLQAMLKAHPYEEPAYDIYRLENKTASAGAGRVGVLKTHQTLKGLAQTVKRALGLGCVQVVGQPDRIIERVALCSGGGGGYLNAHTASIADVYISGDIKYSAAREAAALGLSLIMVGHYDSEIIVKEVFKGFLERNFPGIEVLSSEENKNVVQYL